MDRNVLFCAALIHLSMEQTPDKADPKANPRAKHTDSSQVFTFITQHMVQDSERTITIEPWTYKPTKPDDVTLKKVEPFPNEKTADGVEKRKTNMKKLEDKKTKDYKNEVKIYESELKCTNSVTSPCP